MGLPVTFLWQAPERYDALLEIERLTARKLLTEERRAQILAEVRCGL